MLVALLMTACVHWEAVAPTHAPPRLPRWVRVTTRDSVERLLRDAAFHHDTLVGRASDDTGAPVARIPASEIVHLEARVPSLAGSAAVAAVILGAVVTFFVLLGQAVSH